MRDRERTRWCMPPSGVILIRHGQAESNLNGGQTWIRDAALTQLGQDQCGRLRNALNDHPVFARIQATHVLVSPLIRAIETYGRAFPGSLNSVKALVLPELQETSAFASDTPREASELKADVAHKLPFMFESLDWTRLSATDDTWHTNTGRYAHATEPLLQRAAHVRDNIAKLDGLVVVVSHGAFIRILLGLLPCLAESTQPGYYFNNCEARLYSWANNTFLDGEVLWQGL